MWPDRMYLHGSLNHCLSYYSVYQIRRLSLLFKKIQTFEASHKTNKTSRKTCCMYLLHLTKPQQRTKQYILKTEFHMTRRYSQWTKLYKDLKIYPIRCGGNYICGVRENPLNFTNLLARKGFIVTWMICGRGKKSVK